MTDVINLMCDYASGGAAVDRGLIAVVEEEIKRLNARLDAVATTEWDRISEERNDARLCARVLWDWIGSNTQSAPMGAWGDRWPWLLEEVTDGIGLPS